MRKDLILQSARECKKEGKGGFKKKNLTKKHIPLSASTGSDAGLSFRGGTALCLLLKLQYFGHLTRRVGSLEKTDAGRVWGQEDKGTTGDEMAGWHHRLDGHEFE